MSGTFPEDEEPYPMGYVDVRLERPAQEGDAVKTHPKVAAAGAAGAFATVIVWLAREVGIDMPPEVAAAWVTVLAVVAGWAKAA